MFYNKHVCQILRYDFDFMSHMSFMLLCRQFIKGVGGGPKMKKNVFFLKKSGYKLYNKLQNKSKWGLAQIFA